MLPEKCFKLLQLLMWIFCILDVSMEQGLDCYPCQDYNKNNKVLDECYYTEDDCEGCLEGYEEYPWSPFTYCGPSGLVIIDQNVNASFSYGTTVLIKSQFEIQQKCVWMRNDFVVENENLNFIKESNGDNATDCSIQLDINWESTGNWQSQSQSIEDDMQYSIDGLNLYITIIANVTEHPQNASGIIGKNVTLSCHFDLEISCIWLHNGTETKIEERYCFLDGNGDGQNCSIQISDFKETDAGTWNCGCKSNSSLEQTISNTAWLLTTVPEQDGLADWVIVVIVILIVVVLIVLICVVLCMRYGYKIPEKKPDESIEMPERKQFITSRSNDQYERAKPPVILQD